MTTRFIAQFVGTFVGAIGALTALAATGQAETAFTGSFSATTITNAGKASEFVHTSGYTLVQRGTQVCGEWYEWTSKHMREGLVQGQVKNGILELAVCSDQEAECTFAVPLEKPQRFKVTKRALELLISPASGNSIRYMRDKPTEAFWETNMPSIAPKFFEACKR